MRYKKNRRNVLLLVLLIFGVTMFFGSAHAMQFRPGDDTIIDFDVQITYGAGWRVSDQDSDKLADINTDDGNRNFEQWDMINNKGTIVADIDIQHKDFGIFARPKAFYDYVYNAENANDSPATNNAFRAGLINENDEWPDDVEDVHGRNWEMLDLFAYASMYLGNHYVEFRVGQQVISWGESLLIQGGIASGQSHVDAAAAVAVGTELKEIFLPSESAYIQVGITDSLNLMGYYQWKWEKTRLYEGGTFFASSADFLDDIGAPILAQVAPGVIIPVYNRGQDDDASDSGQFGIGVTYLLPWINDTEIGVYYLNYHEKAPMVNLGAIPTVDPYFLSYKEDVKLYGFSFSSQLGDTNISGEFSYRQDFGFGPMTEANYWQAQTSWIHAGAPPLPVAPYFSLVGEVALNRSVGLMDDAFGWLYSLKLGFDWYQVLTGLDIGLDFAYADVPIGNAIVDEGVATGSVGVEFLYDNVYKATVTYENEFNSRRNANSDRDTLSLALTYTF